MASPLNKVRDDTHEALNAQVAELRKELTGITSALSKQGHQFADTAQDSVSDLYETVRERGSRAADELGKQAKVVGETARNNPLAAAVVVAGLALLISFIARR